MKVLVVEDQRKMAQYLKQGLTAANYVVDVAELGKDAENLAFENQYDVILLDVMLPDQSGFETAKNMRKEGVKAPILMLTALNETKDKIKGLDAGADDYLSKPFEFDELLARIRALLRRNQQGAQGTSSLSYEDLELDLLKRVAKRSNSILTLTQKEFQLLEYFLRNPERPLTRTAIAEHVWETDFDGDSNVIDVYINLLRKKVDKPFPKKLIQTVVGTGYALKTSLE